MTTVTPAAELPALDREQLPRDYLAWNQVGFAQLDLSQVTRVQPCTYFYPDEEPVHFLRLWLGDRLCIDATLGSRESAYDTLTELRSRSSTRPGGRRGDARPLVDEAFRDTVAELTESAFGLFDRMIDAKAPVPA